MTVETYEQLTRQISDLQTRVRNYKRSLKEGIIGSTEGLESQLHRVQIELDNLMLIKIQHDLLSYIKDGGLPLLKYLPSQDIYEVSIPGSDTAAFINLEGVSHVHKYALEHDNQKAAERLRAQDEKAPNKT